MNSSILRSAAWLIGLDFDPSWHSIQRVDNRSSRLTSARCYGKLDSASVRLTDLPLAAAAPPHAGIHDSPSFAAAGHASAGLTNGAVSDAAVS